MIPGARLTNLITLDWGTSCVRAHLLDADGTERESRTEPWGIMHVPDGDFSTCFVRLTASWRARFPEVTTIAAGMIGSAHGWHEASYCHAPAGAAALAAALAAVPGHRVFIVPGVAQAGDAPDVMRGEETQVIGALALRPELAKGSLLVLPGTHSKWVNVSDGCIDTFRTFMTGELFAVLMEHSILGRFAPGPPTGPASERSQAFARGVLAARDSNEGITPLLFSARALVLLTHLRADASPDYLSGLLIGDELRCGLAAGARPQALIGDPALCARYGSALALFDIHDVPVLAHAAQSGLWEIARLASLRDERVPHSSVSA